MVLRSRGGAGAGVGYAGNQFQKTIWPLNPSGIPVQLPDADFPTAGNSNLLINPSYGAAAPPNMDSLVGMVSIP
jgi:hypothetical protein